MWHKIRWNYILSSGAGFQPSTIAKTWALIKFQKKLFWTAVFFGGNGKTLGGLECKRRKIKVVLLNSQVPALVPSAIQKKNHPWITTKSGSILTNLQRLFLGIDPLQKKTRIPDIFGASQAPRKCYLLGAVLGLDLMHQIHWIFPSTAKNGKSQVDFTLPKTNSKSTWKWMVGILVSFWGPVYFQGLC